MLRLALAALLLVPCLAVRAGADDIEEGAAARAVTELLREDPGEDVRSIWLLAGRIQALGAPALPALRREVETASAGRQLAIARALVLLEDYTRGLEVLRSLAGTATHPSPLRAAALDVVGHEGEPEDAEWLEERIDLELDPRAKLAMAKALWDLNRSSKAKGKEVMLDFLRSTDPDLRALGALALGEIGSIAEARPILRQLADEPTERGRSAALLMRLLRAERVIEAMDRQPPTDAPPPTQPVAPTPPVATPPSGWPLLDEIWDKLSRAYAFPEKVADREAFEDAAAAGLTAALDEHTAYLTPVAHGALMESLDPSYGGIGAYVANDPDNGKRFTISRPIYGGPVYEADLRAGDVVVMVEETPTAGLSADECVKLLRGPPGTKVRMSVVRPGWTEPREYVLTRERIVIPTAQYDVLPGDIGFLQLQHFSEETADEVDRILTEFARRRVQGILLDVRSNTGGYLKSAVEIASQFLPRGTTVVTETGRQGIWPERRHVSDGRGAERPDVPIVVLVNQGTASASEILAGALKDTGRAILVGQMTYGKGTAQVPLPLDSRPGEPFTDSERPVRRFEDRNRNGQWDEGEPFTFVPRKNGEYDGPERFTDANGNGVYDAGEAFVDANGNGTWDDGEVYEDKNGNGRWDPGGTMKLTVARYLTPSGFNPNGELKVVEGRIERVGGIAPDVLQRPSEDYDFWEIHEQRKLEATPAVRDYVARLFETDRPLMERLARSDQADPQAYPGFQAFYDGLASRLEPEAVRWLVRYHTRRLVGNELGRELVGDVVDDLQLQRALVALFEELGKDIREVEGLAFVPGLLERAAARTKAAEGR
jgi:carboxyl-terminal processing protease